MDIRTAEKLENFYTRLHIAMEKRFARIEDSMLGDGMNYVAAQIKQLGTDSTTIATAVRQAFVAIAKKSIEDTIEKKGLDEVTAGNQLKTVTNITEMLTTAAQKNQLLNQVLSTVENIDAVVVPSILQIAGEWQTIVDEAVLYIQNGENIEGLLAQPLAA